MGDTSVQQRFIYTYGSFVQSLAEIEALAESVDCDQLPILGSVGNLP
jgi:hypothetical protein